MRDVPVEPEVVLKVTIDAPLTLGGKSGSAKQPTGAACTAAVVLSFGSTVHKTTAKVNMGMRWTTDKITHKPVLPSVSLRLALEPIDGKAFGLVENADKQVRVEVHTSAYTSAAAQADRQKDIQGPKDVKTQPPADMGFELDE